MYLGDKFLKNTKKMSDHISNTLKLQRAYFATGTTKDVAFRIDKLKLLKQEILNNENEICEALDKDFQKPEYETLLSEVAFTLIELSKIIKNLKSWSKPKSIKSSLLNFPSSDYIYYEPYGTTLVISPWNYPFQLAMSPLIGAIAAGNTVVLKPSELAPYTAQLLEDILKRVFKEEYACVIQGGVETSQELLAQKWDYVFFTGSVAVGKIVAKAIAPNLTPSTLELGGKSPCIIHHSAKIELAAKRIVWGKFLNAGQTCIAPDYILIDKKVKSKFIDAVKKELIGAYGEDINNSSDFARIINEKHFERLSGLLKDQEILVGGTKESSKNYIAPTLLDEPNLESEVMQEEIFGPILPLISYEDESKIGEIIHNYSKPLSLYIFSEDKTFSNNCIKKYSFGGGVINDVVTHIVNSRLPFGGVGDSGHGSYHGKPSFETFSHTKSISKRGTWLDLPFRYAPYNNKANLFRKILKYF